MLVLPGPGVIVIALGFGILGTEYAWAAMAYERMKGVAGQVGRAACDGVVAVAHSADAASRYVRQRVTRR